MAEKEGFEPSIPFWGIHDFQSCALGQLRDFSMRNARFMPSVDSFHMILQKATFVKQFLLEFQKISKTNVTAFRLTVPSM